MALQPAWHQTVGETILVNVSPAETRVVVCANNAVQDIYIERGGRRGLNGNVYYGKVMRVLPGLQAAFVDFGCERTGLLHAADLGGISTRKPGRAAGTDEGIEYKLHAGQKLVVQVIKDPLDSKGARLTTEISLSSRFLVFLPSGTRLRVSRHIEDKAERAALLLLLQEGLAAEDLAAEGGYILRTAARGADLIELRADLRFLRRLWAGVQNRSGEDTAPRLLYEDLPLHLRVARDLARPDLERILVDDHASFLALSSFCTDYVPELVDRLAHHTDCGALFDQFGIEEEIQQALSRRVELGSGAYLVIDETEAMTTVDVNTGAFVGGRNAPQTILTTNLEAAQALARQLRLRNLGGIIVVDFIDMDDQEHRQQVRRALQAALQLDARRTTFNGMSELGLVALTRKRQGESLRHLLCEDCPACNGLGVLKSARTVCFEIYREIIRTTAHDDGAELLVVAAQSVVNLLLSDEAASLAALEAVSGKTIRLRPESRFGQEHFDIAML